MTSLISIRLKIDNSIDRSRSRDVLVMCRKSRRDEKTVSGMKCAEVRGGVARRSRSAENRIRSNQKTNTTHLRFAPEHSDILRCRGLVVLF